MKKITTEQFIERAKAVHGERYDYSKLEYINSQTKVCIICPTHGEFTQLGSSHLRGCGCLKCATEHASERKGAADLSGRKFGRLTVIKRIGSTDKTPKESLWLCRCDCGSDITIPRSSLVQKRGTKSCGCLLREVITEKAYKHGQHKSRLYRVWAGMLNRCRNPHEKRWMDYGGRGIRVCDEWHDFKNFYKWAQDNGWDDTKNSKEQSLDRIDVNGNYEPSNCRWADAKTQSNNRTNNSIVIVGDIQLSGTAFCRLIGLPPHQFLFKLRKGLDVNFILSNCNKYRVGKISKKVIVNGNRKLNDEWIHKLNLCGTKM